MTGARHPTTVRSWFAVAYRLNGRFFLTRVNLPSERPPPPTGPYTDPVSEARTWQWPVMTRDSPGGTAAGLGLSSPRVRIILLTLALCTTLTVTAMVSPQMHFAYRQPGGRIVIETAAGLVATLAAFLVAGRFMESHRLHDLLLATALSVLAAANLLLGAVPASVLTLPLGSSWTWADAVCLVLGACLFGLAAIVPDTRVADPRRWAIRTAVAIGAVTATLVTAASMLPLPPVIAARESQGPPMVHVPLFSAMQFITLLAFGLAAIGLVRRSERTQDAMLAWFAAGAVAAMFTRVTFFLYPATDVQWLYLADVMRLLSYLLIVAGAAYEIFGYWQQRAEAAVLEERRRLARDLHDGVAQELAYISRMLRMPGDDIQRANRVRASADRALDESRRAIAALTRPLDEPLDVVIPQTAEEVAERSGGDTFIDFDIDPAVRLGRDRRDVILRVTAEAVSNAVRHGRASRVSIALRGGDSVQLVVEDDGDGFRPDAVVTEPQRGFGITAMRERVEAAGGRFKLASQSGHGTRVEVEL
jgi:signal transduction histidine kinase